MKNILTPAFLFLILILTLVSCNSENTYQEKNRPQYHFSPPEKWMNDPNGLVFYDGDYHLFYQYYPDSTIWGPMHWGHALSTDLVHWKNLPIALYPDTLGYIFSGSAVVDWNNQSGLQTGDNPPIVAIFTQHSEERLREGRIDFQNQSIAYSNDKGMTFRKYIHNPVISNPGERDFRDPKVIRDDNLNKWILVLAAGQKVEFFSSMDLLHWEYMSDFGTGLGAHGGVWECPDLFPLKINNLTKWVLLVSINPGGPNGGSATQYFIGDFDGTKFINENSDDSIKWLDFGPDDYAGVTYSDIPAADGRRLFIGWMNNWTYAQTVPTVGWRSAMTLPRQLKLKNISGVTRVCSTPVEELTKLRTGEHKTELWPDSAINITGLNEISLSFDLKNSPAADFGLAFSNSLNEKLTIGFDSYLNQFYIDRSESGITDFSAAFAKRHFSPRYSSDNTLNITLYLDYSSVELFADDGSVVMTETFFPNENFHNVVLYNRKGKVKVNNCIIYDLQSIWKN